MKHEIRTKMPVETPPADGSEERWLPSPTSSDYEVSSLGNVRRVTASKRGHSAGMMLRPRPNKAGYLRICEAARGNGKQMDRYIHRLVCEAFLGPAPTSNHEVAHLDGDKSNNRASNLRWATHIENERDKNEHGTRLFGEAVAQAKLTPAKVVAIRKMIGQASQRVIASQFGVCQMTISKIARRETWRCV